MNTFEETSFRTESQYCVYSVQQGRTGDISLDMVLDPPESVTFTVGSFSNIPVSLADFKEYVRDFGPLGALFKVGAIKSVTIHDIVISFDEIQLQSNNELSFFLNFRGTPNLVFSSPEMEDKFETIDDFLGYLIDQKDPLNSLVDSGLINWLTFKPEGEFFTMDLSFKGEQLILSPQDYSGIDYIYTKSHTEFQSFARFILDLTTCSTVDEIISKLRDFPRAEES